MFNRVNAAIAAAIATALIAAGCGGGGDSTTTSLSKAEFIKKGDAVCTKIAKRYAAGYEEFAKKKLDSSGQLSQANQKELVTNVALPPFEIAIEEFRELPAPSGEEAEVDAIIKGLEDGVAGAREDPAAVISGQNPFEAVDKQATAYGFKVCGGL